MFDHVTSVECPAPDLCPACLTKFTRQRRNQQFCSRDCQKNASRGSRKVSDSWEAKRRSHAHYSRALWLAHDLYTSPPNQRLGFMAEIITAARTHDAQLRGILTDPRLLCASRDSPGLFFRRCPASYKTIAQAADRYCRKFWGHGVRPVIFNRCPEPETGEVL